MRRESRLIEPPQGNEQEVAVDVFKSNTRVVCVCVHARACRIQSQMGFKVKNTQLCSHADWFPGLRGGEAPCGRN